MKKNWWLCLIAGVALIAAAAVAVALFVRKKSKALAEHLDYDPDDYFEEGDEDSCEFSCEECGECCCCGEECEEEETMPLYPDETAAVESEAIPADTEDEE